MPEPSVKYLTTPIVEVRVDPPRPGSGMTRDGYTKTSGAPTDRMIRLKGEKKFRRLMVWQFSNLGTLFVRVDGEPLIVREENVPEPAPIYGPLRRSAHHSTVKRGGSSPRIAYWVRSRGAGGRDSVPVYVLGTCRRADEGIIGHDLRVRPLRLGKGPYTMVVSPDDVEDKP